MTGSLLRDILALAEGALPYIAAFVAFGVVVFVHEAGHFFAAKIMGVRVLKFSLGWGGKLIGFKRGHTEYMISWFPLGGYVKMAGDEPSEEVNNNLRRKDTFEKHEFLGQPWWSKIFITFAGSFINLVLGVIIFFLVFLSGIQYGTSPSVVGSVEKGSVAEHCGFKKGDAIIAIDGKPAELTHKLYEEIGEKTAFTAEIERSGRKKAISVELSGKNPFGLIIFLPAVVDVSVGTPAYKAGLKSGDLILKANEKEIAQFTDIIDVVKTCDGKPVKFLVSRGGKEQYRVVTPVKDNIISKKYMIGISSRPTMFYKKSYGLKDSFLMAVEKPVSLTLLQVKALWLMAKGKQSVKDSVGGPLMMFQMAREAAEKGPTQLLLLTALLSTIVGALNLILPIPVLDGGVILIYLFEGIIRRPVPLKTQMALMYAGWAIVMVMIIGVFSLDIFNMVIRTMNR